MLSNYFYGGFCTQVVLSAMFYVSYEKHIIKAFLVKFVPFGTKPAGIRAPIQRGLAPIRHGLAPIQRGLALEASVFQKFSLS